MNFGSSSSSSASRSFKQGNALNNLDLVKHLLNLKVVEFLFLTLTCENTFLKVHGSKHGLLALKLTDGSFVLTDFGTDGISWKTVNQINKYTQISSYPNPYEYSLQDVVDCPNGFSKEYSVTDNNCFHYVNYILGKMTSYDGEAGLERQVSEQQVFLSVVTDVALIGVGIVAGPIGWIALGGKFIINILK